MPRVNLGDQTGKTLKGILVSRGMNGAKVAKLLRKPVSTVTYQIRNAENMTIDTFRAYVNAACMTDEEILRVIKE